MKQMSCRSGCCMTQGMHTPCFTARSLPGLKTLFPAMACDLAHLAHVVRLKSGMDTDAEANTDGKVCSATHRQSAVEVSVLPPPLSAQRTRSLSSGEMAFFFCWRCTAPCLHNFCGSLQHGYQTGSVSRYELRNILLDVLLVTQK